MNISFFTYCSEVESVRENDGTDQINIEGPFTSVALDYIPGMFSFSIAFGLSGLEAAAEGETNTMQIVFRDTKNEILADTGIFILPPVAVDNFVPAEYRGINLNLDYRNITFQHQGVYTTEVYYNTKPIGSFPLYVHEKEGKKDDANKQ